MMFKIAGWLSAALFLLIVQTFAFDLKPETPLSHEATELSKLPHRSVTKAQVIERLGAPTWAVLPGEPVDGYPAFLESDPIEVELAWRNGDLCPPVSVHINYEGQVTGWNLGYGCLDEETRGVINYDDLYPDEQFSCLRDDRAHHCSVDQR